MFLTDGNLRKAKRGGLERLGDWLGRRRWEAGPRLTQTEMWLLDRVIAVLEEAYG